VSLCEALWEMRIATVMAVMEDGEGGGVGRIVRSEISVSGIDEGEITSHTKSAVSIATSDVVNMAVVVSGVVIVVSSIRN
jgi:hypothetical protein